MTLRPPQWDYRGLTVLIVATSLGLAVVISIVGLAASGRPIGEKGGEVLAAICGGLVGVIASYVAGRWSSGGGNEPPPPPGSSPEN